MWWLFIVIGVIAVIAILYVILNESTRSSTIKHYINKIKEKNKNAKIEQISGSNYELKVYNNDGVTYYVKFINIPSHADLCINNKSTYEVKYGAGERVGKAQPNSKFIPNLASFINLDVSAINVQKIIVAYPQPKSIVKWINENEMIIVNSRTDCYGVKVVGVDDMSLY